MEPLMEPLMAMKHKRRGLTLIELVIALALLALLASLALPSFAGLTARAKVKSAAEMLTGDLAEARFEAARRGLPLHVEFGGSGADWCWAVATTPGCPCGERQACQLKAVHGVDHAGITLQPGAAALVVQPDGQADAASVLFVSARGDQLRVDLSRLGRASICAPANPVAGYAAC